MSRVTRESGEGFRNRGDHAHDILRTIMTILSEKEIIAGLQKLGIDSETEVNSFLKEYREYCTHESTLQGTHTYRQRAPLSRTFPYRLRKTCLSALTFLGNVLSIPRVNVHNQGSDNSLHVHSSFVAEKDF